MTGAAATLRLAAVGVSAMLATALFGAVAADETPVARGARIAALGNGHGAPACASCHSFDGVGDPSGAFPRLAGQSADYLRHALDTFADGSRRNAVMGPVATALSGAERGDVAAYYALVTAPIPPFLAPDPHRVAEGRLIATVGLNDQQIPACAACHGPYGHGVDPTVPTLAGQYPRFIVYALEMFQNNYRTSDQMGGIAHALTATQAQAVAAYFQQVPKDPSGPKAAGLEGGSP